MEAIERRIGLEQEFFLVDEAGTLSHRSDEFLMRCREVAEAEGLRPEGFVEECSRYVVEINTPPAYTVVELAEAYRKILNFAIQTGRELGLRLYSLATYPLPVTPALREEPRYELQARTLGRERFLHAGRCVGIHLHLELLEGTVDTDAIVSRDAPSAAREELLNLYNLGTALDPALIALSRSCPFYERRAPGLAVRTAFYRGNALFGWEGLYTDLPEVGDLRPYARNVEELVERRLSDHQAWLEAMDRAGVERRLFFETGGNALKSSWSPVRLNQLGTVELRGINGNYPEFVLAVTTLVHDVASRVRGERLTVEPVEGARTFKVSGDRLFVPDFGYLNKNLFYAVVTEGVESPEVSAYLDSVLEFAAPDCQESGRFRKLRSPRGVYRTTEAEILHNFPPANAWLSSSDEGLRLVRQACDKLEEQVSAATRAEGSGP